MGGCGTEGHMTRGVQLQPIRDTHTHTHRIHRHAKHDNTAQQSTAAHALKRSFMSINQCCINESVRTEAAVVRTNSMQTLQHSNKTLSYAKDITSSVHSKHPSAQQVRNLRSSRSLAGDVKRIMSVHQQHHISQTD